MVDDKKSKERLKKFQTQKNPAKKWKCMRKILEKESPDGVKQFWKQNADEIMACTIAFTAILETTKDTEKIKKTHEQEVSAVLQTMKEIFENLRTQVVAKWKHKEISSLLTKFLAKEHKASLRKSGFDLLCAYMELLFEGGGGVELEAMMQLLRQAINLRVFVPEVPGASAAAVKETQPSVPATSVLIPSASETTIGDSIELLDSLLAVLTNASASAKASTVFEWWWTVVKTSYLVYFYPEVWKRVGMLDLADTHGFSVCPPSIQIVLVRRIESWQDNAVISTMLWNESNAQFSIEVLKQACELPLQHFETIGKVISVYKYHLLHRRNTNVISDQAAQGLWSDFISHICNVISVDPQPKFADAHSKLILSALPSFEYLTFNCAQLLLPETWRHLQFVLLESTMTFLRKNQSNMLSDSKNDIVRNAEDIIAMLFTVWIRSPITTVDMWSDFHKYFSSTSDWPHAIRQWRLTVLKLTGILVKFVYTDKPVFISVVEPSRRPTVVAASPSMSKMSSIRDLNNIEVVGPLATPRGTPRNTIHVSNSSSDIETLNGPPVASSSSGTINHRSSVSSNPTGIISAATATSSSHDTSSVIPPEPIPADAVLIEVTKDEFLLKFAGVATWTKDRIKDMWMTVLNIVGNLNAIKSSLNFELAMRCVSDVVSMLLEAESTIPLSGDYRRIPPIEIFFPWIMEACFATGEKIRGVIIAFQVLCQLFCCQSAQPHSTELLAHFYRAIQVGLKNDNSMVRDQIITEARHIFSYGLPGCTVLIPDLLTEVASIFKTRATVPEVQKHAMTLFNSLICYVNHHKDINIPDIGKIHQLAQTNAGVNPTGVDPVITPVELRDTIATLMASFLNNNMDPSAKGHILWGACVMLFEEITHENPRMPTTTQCLQALLFLARHPHDGVAVNAANVLTCLADFFDLFNAIDKNLPYSMINLISDSIALTFGNNGQPPPLRDSVIVALFDALTAWLSAGANDFLRDKAQAPRVFNAIELGLFGQVNEPTKLANASTSARLANEEDNLTAPMVYLLGQLRDRPSHNSASIKAAAESALYTALELVNNFPTPAGATMISSQTEEIPDIPVAFFINNHEQLFSVQILGHPNAESKPNLPPVEANLVRIIVRDSMGKHCWDMSLDYREHPMIPRSAMFDEPMVSQVKPPAAEAVPKKTDLLATLLSKYDEKHLDCLPQAPKFNKFTLPPNPHESYAADIERIKGAIVSTMENDAQLWKSYSEPRPAVNDLSTNAPEPVSHMTLTRIALSHLGYLSPMSRRNFHLVQDCDELRQAIAELDQLSAREQHLITVRYVAPGQEEKFPETAPAEPKTSPLFEKFLSGLGWKVKLPQHQGLRGHLTPESSPLATYYATATTEVLFEVLPHIENEQIRQAVREQNLVEVVWSEHRRDYVPEFPPIPINKTSGKSDAGKAGVKMASSKALSPIGSAQGSVNDPTTSLDLSIGIYPLANGQFRISMLKRDTLANLVCGPLMHGMVVSSKVLPTLVRLSASFARRRALAVRQADWKSPRMTRMMALRQLSQDFRAPRAGELFHSSLYPLVAYPEIGVCSRKKPTSTASSARNSASFVPNMVDAAKAERAAAELAAAELAAAAAAASTDGTDATGDAAEGSASPKPNAPPRLGHVKSVSRSYGVSRSAGSGRSLVELMRMSSTSSMNKVESASTPSSPQQTGTHANAGPSGTAPPASPRAPESPRVLAPQPSPRTTTQTAQVSPRAPNGEAQNGSLGVESPPPPPPAESPAIEEVVLPVMNPAMLSASTAMETSPFDDDISPFDDVVPPPPEEPEPESTVTSTSAQQEAAPAAAPITIPAPSVATAGTGASHASPNNARAPSGSKLTASFKQPARPPAASISVPSSDAGRASTSDTADAQVTTHNPDSAPTPANRPPAQSTPIPVAESVTKSPPAAIAKNFGGPGKLPSGFKVPYGVGNFKVPAGVPKAPSDQSPATPTEPTAPAPSGAPSDAQ
jgi:hypothetical protein